MGIAPLRANKPKRCSGIGSRITRRPTSLNRGSRRCWTITIFVGYLKVGLELRELMRKLHGSVAKLVNDLLPERRVPFWRGADGHDYFDGCLRDDGQFVKAYRYTLMQAVRARMVRTWREYPHTRVWVELEAGLAFAQKHRALLYGVPYKRYEKRDET